MTLDRYSSKNPLCQGWKFDLIDMAGNAELHKQNVIVSALVVETNNEFLSWRPKDFLHQLFWPRHCHLFSYITDHYSSTYWGEKNTKKMFKRTKKNCLKRKTTHSRRFVPCFGFSTLVRRMRGGLWITPPGFFLSKNQSHPALYYTTRCFFSVSIFPNYHLNSKSPSKIIFDISASYSG